MNRLNTMRADLLKRSRCGALLALATVSLAGCMTSEPRVEDYAARQPEDTAATRVTNGSIYQTNHDVALFENSVAGRSGDILTIHLVESTSASKKSSTNTKKASNASLGVTSIFGRTPSINGVNPTSAGLGDSTDFSGEGNSAQSNSLSGDVTVTVSKRYSNGNLLVQGQKWLTLNQGQEYVRIQGIVRQADIQPDNTIVSTKVANATISYAGKGALADANAKGWLARFFDSPLTPF